MCLSVGSQPPQSRKSGGSSWRPIRRALATPDFPKDKFYQIGLAQAKTWGTFDRDTTRTATCERMAFGAPYKPYCRMVTATNTQDKIVTIGWARNSRHWAMR